MDLHRANALVDVDRRRSSKLHRLRARAVHEHLLTRDRRASHVEPERDEQQQAERDERRDADDDDRRQRHRRRRRRRQRRLVARRRDARRTRARQSRDDDLRARRRRRKQRLIEHAQAAAVAGATQVRARRHGVARRTAAAAIATEQLIHRATSTRSARWLNENRRTNKQHVILLCAILRKENSASYVERIFSVAKAFEVREAVVAARQRASRLAEATAGRRGEAVERRRASLVARRERRNGDRTVDREELAVGPEVLVDEVLDAHLVHGRAVDRRVHVSVVRRQHIRHAPEEHASRAVFEADDLHRIVRVALINRELYRYVQPILFCQVAQRTRLGEVVVFPSDFNDVVALETIQSDRKNSLNSGCKNKTVRCKPTDRVEDFRCGPLNLRLAQRVCRQTTKTSYTQTHSGTFGKDTPRSNVRILFGFVSSCVFVCLCVCFWYVFFFCSSFAFFLHRAEKILDFDAQLDVPLFETVVRTATEVGPNVRAHPLISLLLLCFLLFNIIALSDVKNYFRLKTQNNFCNGSILFCWNEKQHATVLSWSTNNKFKKTLLRSIQMLVPLDTTHNERLPRCDFRFSLHAQTTRCATRFGSLGVFLLRSVRPPRRFWARSLRTRNRGLVSTRFSHSRTTSTQSSLRSRCLTT
jgi:hypothetical protein